MDENRIFNMLEKGGELYGFTDEELRNALAVAQTRGMTIECGYINWELGFRYGRKMNNG